MSSPSAASEQKHLLDKAYYVTLVYQYLACLTSDDPLSPHDFPINKVDARVSNKDQTIKVPPLSHMLHQQVQQVEYPNLLYPKGASSDHDTVIKRAEAAKGIITDSMFQVQSILVGEPWSVTSSRPEERTDEATDIEYITATAAVEALWTGTIAKDLSEKLCQGACLKARFAMFFEFRGGKIYRQNNYDCFDPF